MTTGQECLQRRYGISKYERLPQVPDTSPGNRMGTSVWIGIDYKETFNISIQMYKALVILYILKRLQEIDVDMVTNDSNGKDLISSRTMFTFYKVDGSTDEIHWHLHGQNSDFDVSDEVDFHWQHNAPQTEITAWTHISIFDNHSENDSRTLVECSSPSINI
ncbi:hypothetical protein BJ170DRAFT_593215 [Xylariales sp. AK1849]|nr:hypothetical protein BJ170DRAFT_593215 [Xylariales sp. AK1849]